MKRIISIITLLLTMTSDAAFFQVDLTVIDNVDETPGDGICKIPGSDFCTLRAAIMEANALPGDDVIILPGDATIQLNIDGANENSAATGDLDITEGVIIGTFVEPIEDFPTVSGANINDRLFDVRFSAGTVIFVNFKIVNGDASINAQNGGGIQVNPFNQVDVISVWFEDNLAEIGGAMYASPSSEINVSDSVFRGNAVIDNGSAIGGFGDVFINQSTFFENINFNIFQQEALYIADSAKIGAGIMVIDNSTIFNNNGSGVYSDGGRLFVNNSTFVDNGRFGLIANPGPFDTIVSIRNSVFNENDLADCAYGVLTTVNVNNYNMSSDETCLSEGGTNLTGPPQLAAVKVDANDWHRYFRPQFNSPLIDSAHPTIPGAPIACELEDQLGLDRSIDGGDRCDRGAIEVSSDIIFYDDLETL